MKAYTIHDFKCDVGYSTVVFAETSGKAKAMAIKTDAFNEFEFTEISARRVPALDQYYRGKCEMDWNNDDDRVAMVRYGNFSCSEDYWEAGDCESCSAKRWCSRNGVAE